MPDINSVNNNGSIDFEGYLESWKDDYWATLRSMNIDSHTVIDISFGNLNFSENGAGEIVSIGGLEMPMEEFKKVISYIQDKGGTVKLSLGGATYPLSQYIKTPSDAKYVAQEIAKVITQFHLNGVDLDIEDSTGSPTYYAGFADNTISMIKQLRQLAPAGSNISLTVPGGAWFDPWTKIIPAVKDTVNYVTFMEYDIWVDPANSYVDQIKWDLDYYQGLWGLTPAQMRLGLMPGLDDMGHNLTLQGAQELAQFAKDKGMNGVMIWSLNRDYEGQNGNSSDAYQNAIRGTIQTKSIEVTNPQALESRVNTFRAREVAPPLSHSSKPHSFNPPKKSQNIFELSSNYKKS